MQKTHRRRCFGARSGRFRAGRVPVVAVVGVVLACLVVSGAALLWMRGKQQAAPGGDSAAGAGVIGPGQIGAGGADGSGKRVAGPEKLRDLVTSATAYTTRGDHAEAEAIYTSAIEQYPDDLGLRTGYLEFLIGRERYEDAYRQAEFVLEEGADDAEMEFLAGRLAASLERYERAMHHFGEAQRIQPENPAYPLMLGNEQMRAGDLDAAQASFVRVTVLTPDGVQAWGALAKLALRQNNAQLALQHAERAIELEPTEPAWRLYQARAMKRLGDAEGALLVLTGLDGEVQKQREYLRTIGECFGLLGRPGEAAARYAAAAEADRASGELAFEAALWYQRAGQMDEARAWGERAVQRGHERAEAWLGSL